MMRAFSLLSRFLSSRVCTLAAFSTLWLAAGCQERGRDGQLLDTPTSGTIQIAVDESFQPIIESHVDTFQKLYSLAHVRAVYGPEATILQSFLDSDSVRDIILSRRLTKEENAFFASKQLVPVTTRIAIDAVAIVLNPANADTLLSVAQLQDLFSGKLTKWKQLNPESKLDGDVTVVFDNTASSTTRYVRDSVLAGQPMTPNVFATKTNTELLDYVASHPGALGVLGVNWISDGDDQQVRGFLKKVRVAALTTKRGGATAQDFVKPYQYYIALRQYPLCRELFIINREGRNGLGTGFASFVAGDKGQRIFLKSGLMPAVPVRREVEFRER